jgi:hypothetical protein
MDNDKSILEKITDKVKNVVNIAANAANEALKPEATPPKVDEYSAANIPLAADGLVSDPVMVPPVAVAPARKSKRAAPKRAIKKLRNTAKAGKKSPRRAANLSASRRSGKAAKPHAKKTNRKTARVAKKARKRTRA